MRIRYLKKILYHNKYFYSINRKKNLELWNKKNKLIINIFKHKFLINIILN